MGILSSLFSAVKKVGSAVVAGAKAAWEKTKEIAVSAINWMAEKSEQFVGSVKQVWNRVSPYIRTHVQPLLKVLANAAVHPWVKAVLVGLDRTLEFLLTFQNSALAKKLDRAIRWAAKIAQTIKEKLLTPAEMQEAATHRDTMAEAAEQLPEDHRHAVSLAAMINNYMIVKTEISTLIDSGDLQDFEHYLRLRATQKLLASAEAVLEKAQTIADISSDDIFLMAVGSALLSEDPSLSEDEAIRLDQIIFDRHGQKLIPFVFEEMVAAWDSTLQSLAKEWKETNTRVSRDMVLLRRLETTRKISPLTADEEKMLAELQISVPEAKADMDLLSDRTLEMQNYVYAAEGFLQTLEKTEEQLKAEGRYYLMQDGAKAGQILIDCAQNGKPWNALSEEEQSLIIDFANIFEEDSRKRTERLITAEVS